MARPRVSVIMANYNAADYLGAALNSVRTQSVSEIEILLADDASRDASLSVARQAASGDPRLRIIEAFTNAGPAAARNRALEMATGEWVAIVDSDDIIHPERFALMLDEAENLQTDAVCDDLTYLTEGSVCPKSTLLGTDRPETPQRLTATSFVSAAPDAPQLGYLKPMIRRDALKGLRYREDIRIGEDHDFYMRFLLNGGRMYLLPQSYYLYRRHAHSLSHRLHPDDVRAMIAVQDDLLAHYPDLPNDLRTSFAARRAALHAPLAFETLVQHIKNRRFAHAMHDVIRRPGLLKKLGRVALSRAWRKSDASDQPGAIFGDPSQWSPQDWARLSGQKVS
ncbi:glycosyltransferase family 2 protein [Yoonia sp. SDW83-1]|uniref:glycosyltransferase family 2 protein n=1 Tax=Yoonia sp. SDW83-1 TaxID=3366945 RepID=UPI00398C811B